MPEPTLLMVPDGVAGWEQSSYDGQTPLERAETPNLDRLAQQGKTFRLKNIPDECPPDSGIANLSLLGYDPREFYAGRGPLEALNLGVDLKDGEVAFRCNLVNVSDGILQEYSSGNLPSDTGAELFEALNNAFSDEGFRFEPGIRYRGVMVAEGFEDTKCYLPHDEMGRSLDEIFPEGQNADRLKKFMIESREVLENHPANEARRESGDPPANMAWPWGNGTLKGIPQIQDRYGLQGTVVAGVDLINGLGLSVGMDKADVPGATGDFNTDMNAKAERALSELAEDKLVFLHVEATDEAGHDGDPDLKVEMIERYDRNVAGPVVDALEDQTFRVALGPDHYTPVQERTHVDTPVPFVIVDGKGSDDLLFTESDAAKAPLIQDGWNVIADWYRGNTTSFDTQASVSRTT
jgi:2,3-bisphosphoglycerate-independent phosphoglycerate mutase